MSSWSERWGVEANDNPGVFRLDGALLSIEIASLEVQKSGRQEPAVAGVSRLFQGSCF